jgi:hypothetical protein
MNIQASYVLHWEMSVFMKQTSHVKIALSFFVPGARYLIIRVIA